MAAVARDHWLTEATDPAAWRQKIEAFSRSDGDCIVWTGRLDYKGYGIFKVSRIQTGAHRAAWLAHRGPIPLGLVIDHLCRNRACVNTDHMEVVTVKTNTQRGLAGKHPRALSTHCGSGHEYTDANTAWRSHRGDQMRRECRECRRGYRRAQRAA